MVTHCDTVEWEDPAKKLPALGGWVARASKEWRELFRKRYSVERVFRSVIQEGWKAIVCAGYSGSRDWQ